MNKQKLILISIILVFLLIGLVLFHVFNDSQPDQFGETGFREWFWEYRGLDLVVQVILVFAGTLGIAAILPVEEEDD